MNASSPQSTALRAAASDEITASIRLPLFVMFVSAATWLVIGSAFSMISMLTFHKPDLFANCAALTFGRSRPAYFNSVIYGFCIQAGLGVTLWLIARLGKAPLSNRWIATIGAILWNLGVTVGIIGILAGDSTGFENLEMPYYAALLIFIGYLLVGIWTVLTFHQRRERSLFVSQWFFLAALFWFPWIYSTAYLLLVTFPVRGISQGVIAWWFSNNLLVVWLGLVGLATAFYFVPKLAIRDLPSRYLALLTFWILILFGSWGGIPGSAPVPAWIPSLSTSATLLTLILVVTVALNFYGTLQGQLAKIKSNVSLQFISLGVLGFIVAGLMNLASVLPRVSDLTNFTWFTVSRMHAGFYGFFCFVMFGAIYHIVPHLTGFEFPSAKLVRANLWLSFAGILLVIVPLALGGLVQGLKLQDPGVPFSEVLKSTLPFLRASTLGDLLIAAAHLIFLFNLSGVVSRFARARAVAFYGVATADLFEAAQAKP